MQGTPSRDSTRPTSDDDGAGFPPWCPTCLRPLRPIGEVRRAYWACAGCGLRRIA